MHLLKRPHDERTELRPLPPPSTGRVDAPPPEPRTAGPDDDDPGVASGSDPAGLGPPLWGRRRLALVVTLAILAVVTIAALLVLLRPVPDLTVSSFEVPRVALSGEPVVVGLGIENSGGAVGEQTYTILLDGVAAATEAVRVEAGESGSQRVTLTDLTPGTHEIALAEVPEATATVWVFDPPLVAVPAVVASGDEVSVELTLTNAGPAAVSQELVLFVDESAVGSRAVDLAAGDEAIVRFTTQELPAGTPELRVSLAEWIDVIGTVWVVEPPTVRLPDVVETGAPLVGGSAPVAEFEIGIELTNAGTTAVSHELTAALSPGNWTRTTPIEIDPGATTAITFEANWLRAGTYELTVTIDELHSGGGSVWVFDPPEVTLPDVVETGAPLVGGSAPVAEFEIGIELTNAGTTAVSHELTAALSPGNWTRTTPIEIDPGATTTITHEVTGVRPDTYDLMVRIGDWERSVGSVWVPTPADFVLGDVTVSPDPIDITTSRELTVVAIISNLGEAAGTQSVPVSLDGELVERRDVELAGGQQVEETFVIVVGTPGPHEITVGDTTVGVVAHQLERPANGNVLFNQIGGGSNRLRIVNNSDADVVVVLTAPGDDQPGLLAVYVHAGASSTVRGIRSGTYSHYYVFGSDWCAHLRAFTRDVSRGRFTLDGVYESTRSTYTQVDVEFGIADGTGSPSHRVAEDAFPTW